MDFEIHSLMKLLIFDFSRVSLACFFFVLRIGYRFSARLITLFMILEPQLIDLVLCVEFSPIHRILSVVCVVTLQFVYVLALAYCNFH